LVVVTGWQRWWALSGAVYVVLFIVVFVLVGDTGNTATDSARLLASHSDRLFTAFVLGVLTTVPMVAFFAGLRELARAAAPGRSVLTTLVLAPAVVAAALLPGSLALLVGGAQAAHDEKMSSGLAAFVIDAQYPFLAGAYMMLAVAILCASIALLRSDVLPGWLAWFGVVAGVLGLASATFFPIFLVALWVLVASIVLAARPPLPAAA
jgi:hypothetical protein